MLLSCGCVQGRHPSDLAARGKHGDILAGLMHGFGRFLRIYLLKKDFLMTDPVLSMRRTEPFTEHASITALGKNGGIQPGFSVCW